jgi:hypothetical protein
MIYIFGDSWGFSYRDLRHGDPNRDSQVFDGADLASLLMEQLNEQVINVCERGSNIFKIQEKILQFGKIFNKGDTVIVLQTDPLRSYFVPWYARPMVDVEKFKLESKMNLQTLTEEHLLKPFYSKLKVIQHALGIKILLHGGIVSINQRLAEEYDIITTNKSSTEVICPELTDTYFFDKAYIMKNVEYIQHHYDNFLTDDVESIMKKIEHKDILWKSNPLYFTTNHPTEEGTAIVASYLSNALKDMRNAN